MEIFQHSKFPKILNISASGKVLSPFTASYAASKHAIEGFFGSLREEFITASKDTSITLCTLGLIGESKQLYFVNTS